MGMTTGLDSASFQNLQLNAGVFLKKFDYSSITTVEALKTAIAEAMENAENRLGATRGGGSFQAVPQTRNIEADGKRYDFIGSTVYDYWDIHMTGTLLETTPGNVRDVLSSADAVTEGKVTKLTLRTHPEEKDYMDLVWIGDTSKGLMLIGLQNALNTAGMNFTFTDKGEGTLPFDFRAHQEKVNDYDTAPVDIIFLEA